MSEPYPTKEVLETHTDNKFGNATKEAPLQYDPTGHNPSFSARVRNSISVQSLDPNTVEGQIYSMNDVDPALDKKMRLVNDVGPASENKYFLTTEIMTDQLLG